MELQQLSDMTENWANLDENLPIVLKMLQGPPDWATNPANPYGLPDASQTAAIVQERVRPPVEVVGQFGIDVENLREYYERLQWMLSLFKKAGVHAETARRVDEGVDDYEKTLASGRYLTKVIGENVRVLTKNTYDLTELLKRFGNKDQVKEARARFQQIELRVKHYFQIAQEFDQEWDRGLLARILIQVSKLRPLAAREKIFLLDAAIIDTPIKEMPSMRREDWYDDNGS